MSDLSRRGRGKVVRVESRRGKAAAQRPRSSPNSLGSPASANANALERVTTVNGSATLDPGVSVSFVAAQSGDHPAFLTINLPDGTTDGFQKTVVFACAEVLDTDFYRLFATFDEVPVAGSLNYPSGGGGAVLVWNAEEGFWQVAGVYLSST